MHNSTLVYPMLAHLLWVVLLYIAVTVVRAPAVWGIGREIRSDAELDRLEQKVSANLGNQFEWPLLFYVIYTMWYGFGFMYLFEGFGMKLDH